MVTSPNSWVARSLPTGFAGLAITLVIAAHIWKPAEAAAVTISAGGRSILWTVSGPLLGIGLGLATITVAKGWGGQAALLVQRVLLCAAVSLGALVLNLCLDAAVSAAHTLGMPTDWTRDTQIVVLAFGLGTIAAILTQAQRAVVLCNPVVDTAAPETMPPQPPASGMR